MWWEKMGRVCARDRWRGCVSVWVEVDFDSEGASA